MNAPLPEFPDLVGRAARSVVPPSFDTLVDRARRRVRRRRAALATAIVVLVAGTSIGLATLNRHSSAPTPVHPGPIEVILRTGALSSYAGLADGSTLTIWTRCRSDHTHCRSAWLLRDGSSVHSGPVAGTDPIAYAAGDRFVVNSWARLGFVVSADGSTRPLVRGTLDFTPDAYVHGASGVLAVDTTTGRTASLPAPPRADGVADAASAADGSVIALPLLAGPGKVSIARLDKGTWSTTPVPAGTLPGGLVVAGDRAAALVSYDGATVLPVGTLAISGNDGLTWTFLNKTAVPFRFVDSMAAADNTLFVSTPEGTLYRSTGRDWTRFTRVATGPVGSLVGAGNRVLARVSSNGTSPSDRVVAFDRAGRQHPVQLRR